jgi:hypothetical protein
LKELQQQLRQEISLAGGLHFISFEAIAALQHRMRPDFNGAAMTGQGDTIARLSALRAKKTNVSSPAGWPSLI